MLFQPYMTSYELMQTNATTKTTFNALKLADPNTLLRENQLTGLAKNNKYLNLILHWTWYGN